MPLYGHELNEEVTPVEAGLGFAVETAGRQFPGRDRLAELQRREPSRCRVGLALQGKRVPREGYAILTSGEQVGNVTSGTFSPTLQQPIAMGYLKSALAQPGTEVQVDIRGRLEPATIVELPFYRRRKTPST